MDHCSIESIVRKIALTILTDHKDVLTIKLKMVYEDGVIV